VSFEVKNVGSRAGAAVSEIYIGDPSATVPRPVKELKGFSRDVLKPGESRHVTVSLNRRSLAYWDVHSHAWKVDSRRFVVLVGRLIKSPSVTEELCSAVAACDDGKRALVTPLHRRSHGVDDRSSALEGKRCSLLAIGCWSAKFLLTSVVLASRLIAQQPAEYVNPLLEPAETMDRRFRGRSCPSGCYSKPRYLSKLAEP